MPDGLNPQTSPLRKDRAYGLFFYLNNYKKQAFIAYSFIFDNTLSSKAGAILIPPFLSFIKLSLSRQTTIH